MGRNNKRHLKGINKSQEKKRRRDAAEAWANAPRGQDNRADWVLENKRFEAFYRAQMPWRNDEDWDRFMSHLKTTLPACFHIWSDYPFVGELQHQLHEFVGEEIVVDGQNIKAVEPLNWYPGGCGYKLGTDRRSIRKLEQLKSLHKWMMQHTDNGNITRQEAVSMVPPLALDVQPHHRCLDMCASPGSKTSQLLEVVNRSLSNSDSNKHGLVVANDCDTDRAYMLVHQCKRIKSPLLVVTTHNGQDFPPVLSPDPTVSKQFFDRVLCDVPCSGDGTLRKNPAIWKKWNTSMGMSLHPLQLVIAQRGLQLLKEDGLMVYSTCSLSPYEDECVIAQLLRNANGALELVDARQYVPNFEARPGLTSWHVLDDFHAIRKEKGLKPKGVLRTDDTIGQGEEDENDAEAMNEAATDATDCATAEKEKVVSEQLPSSTLAESVLSDTVLACKELGMTLYPNFESVPTHHRSKIRASLFPPTKEEVEWMHLERCLRCVPQDEDTGGFFVATLRKVKTVGTDTTNGSGVATEQQVNTNSTISDMNTVKVAGTSELAETSEGIDTDQRSSTSQDTAATAAEASLETSTKTKTYARGSVQFKPWDTEALNKIRAFYGLTSTGAAGTDSFFVREDTTSNNKRNRQNGVSNTDDVAVAAKSVYFIPNAAQQLLHGDRDNRLKIVTAGVKAFEKKIRSDGQVDYRLLQEGIPYLAPHITQRLVSVSAQDFCNLLGGGLVSYSTLSQSVVNALTDLDPGVVICCYKFDPADVVITSKSTSFTEAPPVDEETEKKAGAISSQIPTTHSFYAICWKGHSRAVNVMVGKIEIESMRHQLAALKVERPKIVAVRNQTTEPVADIDTGNPAQCNE